MNTLIVYWNGIWQNALAGMLDHPSTKNTAGEWAAFDRSLKRHPSAAMAGLART